MLEIDLKQNKKNKLISDSTTSEFLCRLFISQASLFALHFGKKEVVID